MLLATILACNCPTYAEEEIHAWIINGFAIAYIQATEPGELDYVSLDGVPSEMIEEAANGSKILVLPDEIEIYDLGILPITSVGGILNNIDGIEKVILPKKYNGNYRLFQKLF